MSDLSARVQQRLDSLTKPKGSLGQLEEIAARVALIRGELMPSVDRKAMYVFCSDHGIAEEGVSAYPAEVTRQMAMNFVRGGAAINVLCRRFGIENIVVDSGVKGDPVEGALPRKVGPGTRNFLRGPAMSREDANRALSIGRMLAHDAADRFDLCGVGEMGIGNTTSAAAILSAIAQCDPAEAAGPGTGVDSAGVEHKADVIRQALAIHRPDPSDGIGVLSAVGGFEIGTMAGFLLGAFQRRLPVVVDGFISCSALLIARALNSSVLDVVFFSHRSAEPGHGLMLRTLGGEPYFDLRMRLGEGTGAVLMMNWIDAAVALYREMATFTAAGVSER